MSLEARITQLTDAVTQLTIVIESQKAPAVQLPVVEQVNPAPTAAPVMPPPPVFNAIPQVAAQQVGATAAVPFTDPKSLIEYVMAAYKAMGAEKGAGIQGVLGTLGYQNINDVAPAHYAALFAGIEGLK